jgi:eukaryotic-like serine/threonine-protein kinase
MSKPQPPRPTVGYEQDPARKGTVGFGNAVWKLSRGNAASEPQPAAAPPVATAPTLLAEAPPPAGEPVEAKTTDQPRAKDTFDFMAAASKAPSSDASKDTFDFMAAVTSAQTMLASNEAAPAIADAATLDSSSIISAGGSIVSSLAVPARRSTVLPRVELVGSEPRLMQNDRARYEDIAQLGEGGVGEVRKALDNDIGRTVAVKRLKRDMKAPAILVRFMEEIRTIGGLEHPNIVPIHDVGVDEQGEYYFVMKYFDGETLESIIEKLTAGDANYHAMYPFERRMELFEGILEALNYAHANGIIHRDIKPANVMVGRYGEVMVMDWGIARRVRGEDGPDPAEFFPQARVEEPKAAPVVSKKSAELFRTRAGALVGTPAYMSPEQARGESLDERSDIYSLCVLLDELLGLRHYLDDARDLQQMLVGVQNTPVPMLITAKRKGQPVVPADLAWFVHKGVAKNPADRFPSVDAMIQRLRRRKEGDIPIQCQITFLLSVSNFFRRGILRNPTLVTLAMAATVLLFIGLAVKAIFW